MKIYLLLISIAFINTGYSQENDAKTNQESVVTYKDVGFSDMTNEPVKLSDQKMESTLINVGTKSDSIKILNRVDSVEEIHSRTFYEESLKSYMTLQNSNFDLLLENIKKREEFEELMGLGGAKKKRNNTSSGSQNSGSAQAAKPYSPPIKLVALWDGGALIDDNGLKRSVGLGDMISDWEIITITDAYLEVGKKGNSLKYTVK